MRSDVELVSAVQQGEQTAYAELVRRYEKTVLAVATRVLGNIHTAEDVSQETFVKAYKKLGSLRDGRTFAGWIVKITKHQAITELRRRKLHLPLEDSAELTASERNGLLDDESKLLLRAVLTLPTQLSRVTLLHYFDGHSVASIADMTNSPVGTVTQQLSRARKRLQKKLKALKP